MFKLQPPSWWNIGIKLKLMQRSVAEYFYVNDELLLYCASLNQTKYYKLVLQLPVEVDIYWNHKFKNMQIFSCGL